MNKETILNIFRNYQYGGVITNQQLAQMFLDIKRKGGGKKCGRCRL